MSLYKFIKTKPGDDTYRQFTDLPGSLYKANSPRFVLGHEPEEKHLLACYIMFEGQKAVGRMAIYNNVELNYLGESTFCIGSYECIKGKEASKELLNYAFGVCRDMGAKFIIGPMEGSTWGTYRFSLNNDHPNFFMEPYHHEYYNEQFLQSGFKRLSYYVSNKEEIIDLDKVEVKKYEESLVEEGYTVRQIDLKDLQNELEKIGQLSIEGFKDNFLFTPILVSDFVNKYKELSAMMDPRLIWLIEDVESELNAFIFAIKDHLDPSNSTCIIKSIVRKKDGKLKGVGKYLSEKVNQVGLTLGYDKVIHALMIQDNTSRVISEKREAKLFKSYALYLKEL